MNKLPFIKHRQIILLFIYLLGFLCPLYLNAENNSISQQSSGSISGIVKDETGESLIGVTVIVKGEKVGTATNVHGEFTLSIPNLGAVLSFSYIGFHSKEVQIKDYTPLTVVLEEDTKILEEVVVVGYGTQTKVSVTGALNQVKSEEIIKSPVSNVGNALVGRTSGITAVQRSGEPGKDNAQLYVRGVATFADGKEPLVLVDGIERPISDLDPNEIESVNVLKDASSTAVFGVRGANGVIIITTKSGFDGKPQISLSTNFALQSPIRLPKLLNAYDWATLRNRAAYEDSSDKENVNYPFSEFDLERYRLGDDPIFHPDIDWFDYMLKDHSLQQQHNVSIRGGSKQTKYFVSLGYFNQQGAYKVGDFFKEFSANPKYERYNVRINLDFQVTDDFSLSAKTGAQIMESNYASTDTRSIMNTILSANPIMSPVVVDGKMIRNVEGLDAWRISNPPLYEMLSKGYNENYSSRINIDLAGVYKLDKLVKGVSVRGKVAYDNFYYQSISRTKQIPMYDILRDPDSSAEDINPTPIFVPNQYEGPISGGSDWYSKNRRLYGEGGIEYSQKFDGHNVTGLFLGTAERMYNGSNELAYNYLGLVGRLTYNYKIKYLAEFNLGYNGSENFHKSKQFGFFPAVSLGYVFSEESFFPKNNVLNFGKLRGSYGLVGNDKIGGERFLFLPDEWSRSSRGYYFGTGSNYYTGLMESKLGNRNVTWETAKKFNLGLEFRFFNDKVNFSGDIFSENRNDILWSLNLPLWFGDPSIVPPYNVGRAKNKGYELELGFVNEHKDIDFKYWANANYSFARNKIVYMDESPQKYDHLYQTGYRIGQPKGLIAEGFYNTWEEINDPQRPISIWEGEQGLQPGDVKYRDVTGDGIIDENDMTNIGYPNIPEIIYGFSVGFAWKGFEVSALFQGAGHVSTYLASSAAWPFDAGTRMAFENAKESWSQERYEKGLPISLPRLTADPGGSKHNYQRSSLWQQDASYIRLKNAEVSYTFDSSELKSIGLSSIRIYVNGQNLHTWTKMPYFDPEIAEQSGAAYPLMRVFNMGLNIRF